MTGLPLLRPGVLHFLGSFFNLDEGSILDPSCSLDDKKIEKGALSFVETVALQDDRKGTGWEVLYTSLGISAEYLRLKPSESPQSYVSRIWAKMLARQGLLIKLEVGAGRGLTRPWAFKIRSPAELLRQALQKAQTRVAHSPQAKSKKGVERPTFAILQQGAIMREKLGQRIGDAVKRGQRILIVTPDAQTARREIPFLVQNGVPLTSIGTSDLISNDRRLTTKPQDLHLSPVLLLSANYFPLVYTPQNFDLVVLLRLQDILDTVHVSDPLPDFLKMSQEDGRAYPYSYYRDLWKVADLFHIIREFSQNAGEVWATGCAGKPIFFLERLRGKVEVVTYDPTLT